MFNMLATFTVNQLQTVIIAVCAMLTIVIPLIAGMVLIIIQNYGRVKEAWGKVNAINGTLEAHGTAIQRLGERTSQLMARIPTSGKINGESTNGQSKP